MLQRSGVLDQPLAGHCGDRSQAPSLCDDFHAKSFDFLCGPLKLGLKYVGCSNHRPPALGTVLMYLLGPRKAFLGESWRKVFLLLLRPMVGPWMRW
jgi:hypothetical protein